MKTPGDDEYLAKGIRAQAWVGRKNRRDPCMPNSRSSGGLQAGVESPKKKVVVLYNNSKLPRIRKSLRA